MVLTGQYNPQSVDKSVFEVEVITKKEIKQMAGNNLADVLTQTLNISIVPNSGEGRSGISMFGFNSEYVKILVDGIPIIGDEGFGNAIDITQINLDDIEQIEIIEGAMGVQYGSNAVTGVVNIITEKGANSDWEVTGYVQEETIGDEYGWFEEGRHIQSLEIGHNFSDKLYGNVLFTRNDFQGFLNHKQGINYYNEENPNDGLRGYEWLPKEQNNVKALLNYDAKNFQAFYKFGYFHELTNKYANNVILNPNPATETVNPTATDEIFRSERFYHHLNASGKIENQVNFNISLSYQEQVRNLESYTYELKTGNKSNIESYDYNTRKGYFSRGTFNNFFDAENFNFELGYAITLDEGSASGLASQNAETSTQTNTLNSYGFFISSEFKLGKKLSLRPGARILTSSQFGPEYLVSLSGKYQFNKGYQLRAIVGTAPKLPNFEQLYFYMVDSNHNIQGNENLNPEYGKSVFVHLKKTFWSKNYQVKFQPKLSAWYLDVDDKIDLIIVNESPLEYEYNNIDLYRTWGVSLENNLEIDQLRAGLGVAFSGQSKVLNAQENYNDDYLYSIQVNANASYHVPKWKTRFSAFYKLNGPQYEFTSYIDENGETQIRKGKLDNYAWLNASVRKSFFDDRFEVTAGVRNLLDVARVESTIGSGAAHSGPPNTRLLGYGRSYFLKLMFNLNF
ncbi:MAG TPA: TonB-dependent receptor [Flavobacteriaceae bacterium]|nr:TonB-dependent receptor [Flavobacteriaceae bacterium]